MRTHVLSQTLHTREPATRDPAGLGTPLGWQHHASSTESHSHRAETGGTVQPPAAPAARRRPKPKGWEAQLFLNPAMGTHSPTPAFQADASPCHAGTRPYLLAREPFLSFRASSRCCSSTMNLERSSGVLWVKNTYSAPVVSWRGPGCAYWVAAKSHASS